MIIERAPRTWTRCEYDQMVEAGVLGPEDRVELIEGEILTMSPQKSPHVKGVHRVFRCLSAAFGPGFWVRAQAPLAILADSEPEPDVAVVAGELDDHDDAHPSTALLVVEVADTSLAFDRLRKGRVYARAGIPEYWILNLNEAVLEVYREPRGESYAERIVLAAPDSIAPLARPETSISVAELLP